MTVSAANVVEVFSSAQGEGIHVGASTLFVRLGECDLRCRWCDSPHTWRPAAVCRLEVARGSGEFRSIENPVALAAVCEAAEALEVSAHRFVSLTGGEPLLQPEAVRALALTLRARGPRIHLETHGLAVEALGRVVDVVDVVSMDWKLASDVRRAGVSTREAGTPFHAQHARFLALARRAPEVMVKVVVTPATREEELDAMARAVAAVDASIPLVLQPVTPFGPVKETPSARRLLAWLARLSQQLADVRLIPQTHKVIGAP
jgi:organic radical activating enzyme